MKKIIAASEIQHPKGLRARHGSPNKEHVDDLVRAYQAKAEIEPPRVFTVRGRPGYWLTRGAHRLEAMKAIGRTKVECEVRNGTWEEAVHDAVADNQTHGLRRTNSDKKQCVALMIELHGDWTDRKIADTCGVDHKTVGAFRKELAGEPEDPEAPTQETNLVRLRKDLLKLAKEDVPPQSVNKWLEDLIAAAREYAAMIRHGAPTDNSPGLFDS